MGRGAMLVAAVTTLVRLHRPDAHTLPGHDERMRALAAAFEAAGVVLRSAAGPVNEPLLFVHANVTASTRPPPALHPPSTPPPSGLTRTLLYVHADVTAAPPPLRQLT